MAKLPSRDEVLAWINENPTQTSKRDIARAFGIKGAARIDLKRILRDLEDDGLLQKRKKSYREQGTLPPVAVLIVNGPDQDGDLTARPVEWDGEDEPPRIDLVLKPRDPALGAGDRILARLTKIEATYEGRLIRRIGHGARKTLGILALTAEGPRLRPIEKGADRDWVIIDAAGGKDGELVEVELAGKMPKVGLPKGRVVARLGDPSGPKAVSLIAIHQHGIPFEFPEEAVVDAESAKPAGMEGREDLRDLPLITIDPWNARDHDDACCAIPDDDPKNAGGFILWVAIADVAHYVTPGSELDREARKRGNSSYFPDRVVPMLPDALSGDLCSLHEGVERATIAVRMVITSAGEKIAHDWHRGIMRSPAALNYEESQAAVDGEVTERTEPHLGTLRALFDAYAALKRARGARQPLNLDLPEREIVLSEEGEVLSVDFKERLDAHKLIEEFMVLANVAAAETLIAKGEPLLFRVHEEPTQEKLDALRETAGAAGLSLAKGQVLKTEHLNRLLAQAEDTDSAELINLATLRSMTQAYYHPANFGHFGLALKAYAHFTSPIRRYADLIVHRALITAHGWGDDGLSPEDIERLEQTAVQISETERRSMMAERDTTDRYLASFLADRVGSQLKGSVSGISKAGVFVRLTETGADGLVPMRALGGEYFRYDRETQTLEGADTGRLIALGDAVTVRLTEAVPVSGGLILELVEHSGGVRSMPGRSARGKPVRRKAKAAKKSARKVKRRRK